MKLLTPTGSKIAWGIGLLLCVVSYYSFNWLVFSLGCVYLVAIILTIIGE